MTYQTPIERAEAFLADLLRERPLTAETVRARAREARISARLLEVVREAIGVRTRRQAGQEWWGFDL